MIDDKNTYDYQGKVTNATENVLSMKQLEMLMAQFEPPPGKSDSKSCFMSREFNESAKIIDPGQPAQSSLDDLSRNFLAVRIYRV